MNLSIFYITYAFAPAAASVTPKQRIFLQLSRTLANYNTLPIDAAPKPVPTIAHPKRQYMAYIKDIAGYEEPKI